jgi:hypothetical protein
MELLRQPTPHQTLVDLSLEGAQGGTELVLPMEVNKTDYHQLDALISDHPAVANFFGSQGRTMNNRAEFNSTISTFRRSIISRNTTVLLQSWEAGQWAHTSA